MAESRFGRWTLAATLVWSVATLAAHSDTGVAFPAWMALSAVTILIIFPSTLGFSVAVMNAWRQGANVRQASAIWTRSLACIAGTLVAVWLMLPLKTRLFFSGPALRHSTSYLAQLPAERLDRSPPWIGLFRVRSFEQFGGELRFLTSDCGLVDTCGLVYSPGGRPPNRGEDTFEHLYAEWWHWHQSF